MTALHSRCTALRSGVGTSGSGPTAPNAMLRDVIGSGLRQSGSAPSGGGGIRTHERLATPTVFETAPKPGDREVGGAFQSGSAAAGARCAALCAANPSVVERS